MAIGRRPSVTNTQGLLMAGTAGGALRAGAAVGVSVAGIVECSATTSGSTFVGFATTAVGIGDPVYVVCMRGSVVGPILEGGVALNAGSPVWLSSTLGEVTQSLTPPGAGVVLAQLGIATSASTILLNTDFKVGRPS